MDQETASELDSAAVTLAATSPIDRHVGAKVRTRRSLLGLRHDAFAAMIGATTEELRRHEVGECRIDARRLYRISRALDVQADFFFEGLFAQPLRSD
jgi:transcriptional regulator with XRE-family HTH domain